MNIGVIFDMDGVLVDSADRHRLSWLRLAEEEDVTLAPKRFAETFGRHNRDIVPILFGDVDEPSLRRLADRKEAIYRDLIRDNPPLVPAGVELIQALHRRGVRIGVGSSAPKANIDLVLAAMKVESCISAIVSGDDVSRGKPDPQVFLITAERLGLPPECCVVVEDAPAGVQAARAAGAKVVAVLTSYSANSFHALDHVHQPHKIVERLVDIRVEDLLSLVGYNTSGS